LRARTMSGRRLVGRGGGAAVATAVTCMAGLLALLVLMTSPERGTELVEKSSHGGGISTERLYSSMHPQFKRCSAQEDMAKFSALIKEKCGNLKQSSACDRECAIAMRQKAEAFGCCWQTLMEGYRALDKEAGSAWSSWEQSLSQKCGVTFEGRTCKSEDRKSELSHVEAAVSSLQLKEAQDKKLIKELMRKLKARKQQANACFLDGSQLRCGTTTIALSRLPLPHDATPPASSFKEKPDIYSWMSNRVASADEHGEAEGSNAVFPPKLAAVSRGEHMEAEEASARRAHGNRLKSSAAVQQAEKDGHSKQVNKGDFGFLNILSDAWPWQRGAFKDVEQKVHLRPHKLRSQVFGDHTARLRNAIPLVPSPLPDAPASPERKAKVAPPRSGVWGNSHRWGPSDDRMKLEQRTSHRPNLDLGSNSPWSKNAGLSEPHDPAAQRLARAGVNVNGGFQSWMPI